jgi:hypothetical protein
VNIHITMSPSRILNASARRGYLRRARRQPGLTVGAWLRTRDAARFGPNPYAPIKVKYYSIGDEHGSVASLEPTSVESFSQLYKKVRGHIFTHDGERIHPTRGVSRLITLASAGKTFLLQHHTREEANQIHRRIHARAEKVRATKDKHMASVLARVKGRVTQGMYSMLTDPSSSGLGADTRRVDPDAVHKKLESLAMDSLQNDELYTGTDMPRSFSLPAFHTRFPPHALFWSHWGNMSSPTKTASVLRDISSQIASRVAGDIHTKIVSGVSAPREFVRGLCRKKLTGDFVATGASVRFPAHSRTLWSGRDIKAGVESACESSIRHFRDPRLARCIMDPNVVMKSITKGGVTRHIETGGGMPIVILANRSSASASPSDVETRWFSLRTSSSGNQLYVNKTGTRIEGVPTDPDRPMPSRISLSERHAHTSERHAHTSGLPTRVHASSTHGPVRLIIV